MAKYLAFNLGDAFEVGGEGIGGKAGYNTIGEFVSIILPNVYVLAGLIMFFLILLGGIGLISAGGDTEKIQASSKKITISIIGFAIIFLSYWIIQIISLLTGIEIFG